MSNVFLGQIVMFGGNFAPRDFAFCNGQLISIAQNAALFSLLGTAYGGDGVATFALPNLQSALPVHQGTGPGLSSYQLGQTGGASSVTISQSTLPQHTHFLVASQGPATATAIGQTVVPGKLTAGNSPLFYAAQQPNQAPVIPQTMAAGACTVVGGNESHTNLMPSLCITFIIALQGVFPSRN